MTKIYSSTSWAVPALIGWAQSRSNSPCMEQDYSARPQRSFFNVSVSDDFCCTFPPPQVWGSTRGKTVIKKDCSVMSVMSQNCHNWETESPRKSRNYDPHIPLSTPHQNVCLCSKAVWVGSAKSVLPQLKCPHIHLCINICKLGWILLIPSWGSGIPKDPSFHRPRARRWS